MTSIKKGGWVDKLTVSYSSTACLALEKNEHLQLCKNKTEEEDVDDGDDDNNDEGTAKQC